MSEIVIKAEKLGKKYIIGHQSKQGRQYVALRDVVSQNIQSTWNKTRDLFQGKAVIQGDSLEEVWALRDINFEICQGEAVGIIGRNGSGKSTLLKVLSRITEPTTGRVSLRGRVASLLEVGTGFHQELTGRENIYLNGAILGMTRREINAKFDEIVEFSGVDKYLDTPVKRYSSGMYVRLAFAVAAHLEPEILVVDEVLAVGDAEFQRKCLGKMSDVAGAGRTVLFVSHNMGAISRLCRQSIWLNQGDIVCHDATDVVISRYLGANINDDSGELAWPEGKAEPGVTSFKLNRIAVLGPSGKVSSSLDITKPFQVLLQYQILTPLQFCRIGFLLRTMDGTTVFESYDSDNEDYLGRRELGTYECVCTIPGNFLNVGQYLVTINAGIPSVQKLILLPDAMQIEMEDTGATGGAMLSARQGAIRPYLAWQATQK